MSSPVTSPGAGASTSISPSAALRWSSWPSSYACLPQGPPIHRSGSRSASLTPSVLPSSCPALSASFSVCNGAAQPTLGPMPGSSPSSSSSLCSSASSSPFRSGRRTWLPSHRASSPSAVSRLACGRLSAPAGLSC